MDLSEMRKDYIMQGFDETDAVDDAMTQFKIWFEEAIRSQVQEPNAMTLATATTDGKPSARVVLLKAATEEGFVFYTNYESRKADELAENPQAALLFLWLELARQIRIEGTVKKISKEESMSYFYTRPFQSQVSALISPQSKVINGKLDLFLEHQKTVVMYEGNKVPFPENWGGYILIPTSIEFWQGRESRFHDRIQYTKAETGWQKVRLAP